MNEHETRTLWEMGREAWNDWASQILKSKAQFQQAGAFALNWFGEPDNDQTLLWLKVAGADFSDTQFEDEAAFEGFVFPGPVNLNGAIFERSVSFADAEFQLPAKFGRAHFQGDVSFEGAKFQGQAIFDDAVFDGAAIFDRAEFLKERNGPLSHGAKFQRTRFIDKAEFRSAVFIGTADFSKVQFAGSARFDEARFTADAMFENAVFSASASYNASQFLGNAAFKGSQFTGEARFAEASFKGECAFEQSQFWGDASFRDARFEKDALFAGMRVEGSARFRGGIFATGANFSESRLSGQADFSGAAFGGPANFSAAQFIGGGLWIGCRFLDTASFPGTVLSKNSSFKDTQFASEAIFREAQFSAPVSFASCRFDSTADFSAVQSRVAFVLAGADFKHVPSFLETSFHEPPRVDHMLVADPLKRFHNWKLAGVADPRGPFFKLMKVCSDPDASAKFRRLKKLASEAHDQTRELEFFAQELRCRRFWYDKPFGEGLARFWLGWLYGGMANYGRSLLRPAIIWVFSIFLFAFYYLAARGGGWSATQPFPVGQRLLALLVGEKASCASGNSSPIGEALYLSFRNAFLKLDWSDTSTSHRVFGCLYGVEPNGNAIIPLSISSVSLLQVVISAALLFMFLLALRNLLKVR